MRVCAGTWLNLSFPTWPLIELDLGISGGLSASDRLAVDSVVLDQIGLEALQMRDGGWSPLPEEVGAGVCHKVRVGLLLPSWVSAPVLSQSG